MLTTIVNKWYNANNNLGACCFLKNRLSVLNTVLKRPGHLRNERVKTVRYVATADSDIGISKSTNQDSVLIRHAASAQGEVLLAVVCDGMGGLAKGELASATVIRAFSKWFDEELLRTPGSLDMQAIGARWTQLLQQLNDQIADYGSRIGVAMGTTFSGILLANEQYVIAQVGDSRIYHVGSALRQLTTDQSFVAREVSRGNMTPEQAKVDKRRNLLLQCVGASKTMVPQILCGTVEPGTYVLCSDGFVHELQEWEIYETLCPQNLGDREDMHAKARRLIDLVKARMEKDNISVLLVKAEKGAQPVAAADGEQNHRKRRGVGRIVPFLGALVLCGAMALTGMAFGNRADRVRAEQYEQLVASMSDLTPAQALKACGQAVELNPADTRAYMALRDVLAEADAFGPGESRKLQDLYQDNLEALDAESPEVATLRYRLGLLNLNHYIENSAEETSVYTRIEAASPYFLENHQNADLPQEFEKEVLCAGFHSVCSLYSNRLIQQTDAGTAVSDAALVLEALEALLETVSSVRAADNYDKLSAYYLTDCILSECAEGLLTAGGDPDRIFQLFDQAYAEAEALTAENAQQAYLRNEIVDRYCQRRELIVAAYEATKIVEGE